MGCLVNFVFILDLRTEIENLKGYSKYFGLALAAGGCQEAGSKLGGNS